MKCHNRKDEHCWYGLRWIGPPFLNYFLVCMFFSRSIGNEFIQVTCYRLPIIAFLLVESTLYTWLMLCQKALTSTAVVESNMWFKSTCEYIIANWSVSRLWGIPNDLPVYEQSGWSMAHQSTFTSWCWVPKWVTGWVRLLTASPWNNIVHEYDWYINRHSWLTSIQTIVLLPWLVGAMIMLYLTRKVWYIRNKFITVI